MKSRTTRQFRDLLASLPTLAQDQARAAYRLWRADPFHSSLHFKRVNQREPALYSARIDRRHRALGVRKSDAIVRFWIGSHAEYDRVLGQG